MGVFFPSDSNSVVDFIICEIRGFPHQFPIAWENAAKSIKLGEPRKFVPIFSLIYGQIHGVSYGIPYHMANTWFFPLVSKST